MRRPTRSVIPDGPEIQRRRTKAGMTQEELAEKAGLEERTVRKIEAGKSCSPESIQAIAKALSDAENQVPADALILGRYEPLMAMMGEAIRSAGQTFDRAGDILPRMVHALDTARDPVCAELEVLLLLAVRRDIQGDADQAWDLARSVIRGAARHNPQLEARATIRGATFADHRGRIADGVALVEKLLARYPDDTVLEGEYWWALYQHGTLLVKAGSAQQIDKASGIFKAIRENPKSQHGHKLSALHQQGVIALKQRRWHDAEDCFLQCLDPREGRRADDFRRVYDYRRLGELYALMGRLDEARKMFHTAEGVAGRWSFRRYSAEISAAAHRPAKPTRTRPAKGPARRRPLSGRHRAGPNSKTP